MYNIQQSSKKESHVYEKELTQIIVKAIMTKNLFLYNELLGKYQLYHQFRFEDNYQQQER